MRPSAMVTTFVVLLFVVLANQIDESQAIIIPILKPDLRFISEKKKTLLSFLNMQAILQMLGQIVNLGAIMQHFGLAPPPTASAVQKGSGSTNQVTIVPPPDSDEDDTLTASAEGREECTDSESENVTEVAAAPEDGDTTEGGDQHESPEEATEADVPADSVGDERNRDVERLGDQSDEAETTTLSSEEQRSNEIGPIQIGLRRRKLEAIRRRYLLVGRRGIF